jgi:hypothetical protein
LFVSLEPEQPGANVLQLLLSVIFCDKLERLPLASFYSLA